MNKLLLTAFILPIFGCGHHEQQYSIESLATESVQRQISKPIINKENQHFFSVKLPPQDSAMLDVTVINQNPELKFGCEVTSLAMVLNFAGVKTDKMELYRAIQKETDPLIRKRNRDILHWGNPEYGYVGDMTGKRAGTTVFDKPMIQLINEKLPGRAVNLTNQPFEKILEHVADGYPVVVWTTLDYGLPRKWEAWHHGKQIVKVPLDLHAVVLVGYDEDYVYLNDPLTVKKRARVDKSRFISSWKALGSRAVSYSR